MPLDPSFRARLREALQGERARRPDGCETEEERRQRVDEEQAAWIADGLGGWWQRDAGGVCLVVDRIFAGDRAHGDAEIGHYAGALSRCQRALRAFDARREPEEPLSLFGPERVSAAVEGQSADEESRLLFFDLETTGLSGGAGTCAFLIGYGWFEGDAFHTRQYFLSGYGHETALLRLAAEPLQAPAGSESCPTLASFNGKTFDVPLIGGRYLFHRLASPFDALPHIDLLHVARRLWRHRPTPEARTRRDRDDVFGRYFRMTGAGKGTAAGWGPGRRFDLSASAASCALGALEEAVLGFRRTDDVPGADIPARYFQYVRTGDVRPLQPVLEHNRLDLVSLAAVASVVARMLEEGPPAARNAHECLALGRLYEHSGAGQRATVCYERAAEPDEAPAWRDPIVQREALRRLALRHRRDRRYEDAAAAWQHLLDLETGQGSVEFEALHALAVHHEHRSKDLAAARALVVRALAGASDPRIQDALRHRLARIERKLGLAGV